MPTTIRNVSQLCDQLRQARVDRENALVNGILPETTDDLLASLNDDAFLEGTVEAVDVWLGNAEGTEFDQITALEANGLMASAQNAYGLSMRDSFLRRFGRQKMEQEIYKDRGVLDDQMRLVGVIADTPAMLQLSATEEES